MFIIGCGEYDDAQNLAVYTGNEDDLRSFIDTVNLGVPEHKSEFWYQELPKAMNIGELQDMLRRGR